MITHLDLTTGFYYIMYTDKLNLNYNAKPGPGLCVKRSNELLLLFLLLFLTYFVFD